MNLPVQLRTPLSNLWGSADADAYLANYEKKVVEAVGYGAVMRIDSSGGANPVVEVKFWVPDYEDGIDVTKKAIHRGAGAGFITEVIVIPAPLLSTAATEA